MKSFPPYRTFLSFAIVFLCLILIFLIIPGERYQLSGLIPEFRTHKLKSLRSPRPPEISGRVTHPAEEPKFIPGISKVTGSPELPDFIKRVGLEYPESNIKILGSFFRALNGIQSDSSQVRILYYGDSQLEGDRITRYFRQRMQKEYGGEGPGLLSLAKPVYGSLSLEYQQSSNWDYHDPLSDGSTIVKEGLGLMLGYSTYSGQSARVRFLPPESPVAGDLLFNRLRLFLLKGEGGGTIKYSSGEAISGNWTAGGERGFIHFDKQFPSMLSNIMLEFDGLSTAFFLGASLESSSGVLVDNIASRGSAGLEFTLADSGLLAEMASSLQPDLIILQFGINVVPARTDNFDYYRRYLVNQVKHLKKQIPGVPVLVTGVSDMGHLVEGIPRPYSNVSQISEVQKQAAEESGAAFFNLQEFMGGPGSFLKWIDNEPSLMRNDLTHFTYAGGAIVGEWMAELLIREAGNYQNNSGNGK